MTFLLVESRAVSKIEILDAGKEARTLQLDPLLLRLDAARAEKVGRLAREQLGSKACDPSGEACYGKVG